MLEGESVPPEENISVSAKGERLADVGNANILSSSSTTFL